MDGGAWKAAVHGVTKSRTWLSNFTFTFHFHALEKEMATHSSVLAWRIPGMAEPGGLPSIGSHRVRHDWSDLAAAVSHFIDEKTKVQKVWVKYQVSKLEEHNSNLNLSKPIVYDPLALGKALEQSSGTEFSRGSYHWPHSSSMDNTISRMKASLTDKNKRLKWKAVVKTWCRTEREQREFGQLLSWSLRGNCSSRALFQMIPWNYF